MTIPSEQLDSSPRPSMCETATYRTSPTLAVRGTIKTVPEDFVVEELPLYPASGAGDFLFVDVEKRDVAAEELVRRLARGLNIPRTEIGVAGLKDRRAVTRQRVSIPARCEAALLAWQDPQIQIGSVSRHSHKLRTGHLGGNRFTIRLRDTAPDALEVAQVVAARIGPGGYPNLYGDQRFGHDDGTLKLGLDLLRGTATPRDIAPARRKFLLRLALSAVQSALFNDDLNTRLREGLFETVLAGDVLQVQASGGLFVCDDPATDQQRFNAGELALTGPIFGPKMKAGCGIPSEREHQLLERWGLTSQAFEQFSKLTSGTRRPLGIRPADLSITADSNPPSLIFRFTLPPGAYATTLLREYLKESPPKQ